MCHMYINTYIYIYVICMYVSIYTYAHTCVICMHMYLHIYTSCVNMYLHICHMCIYIYIHLSYVYIYMCASYVYIYICIHVSYVYIYIYIYTLINVIIHVSYVCIYIYLCIYILYYIIYIYYILYISQLMRANMMCSFPRLFWLTFTAFTGRQPLGLGFWALTPTSPQAHSQWLGDIRCGALFDAGTQQPFVHASVVGTCIFSMAWKSSKEHEDRVRVWWDTYLQSIFIYLCCNYGGCLFFRP